MMLRYVITSLIVLLASASYAIGIRSVFRGDYRPSIYSRTLWALISLNSFVGVLAMHTSIGILALAGIQLCGSIAMFIGALKYSNREFGSLEKISTGILVLSLVVWLVADLPLLNVLIGLIAHLIGAAPAFTTAWKDPKSENFPFWLLFAMASLLSFLMADKSDFHDYSYAAYFLFFDGILTLITSRKFLRGKSVCH
ncbi:MAG: hypothetical protein HGA31_01890 [Candidatus Moranbacteria bacterium]|nr:hypothetical protein [Candidatus Moranbacteria bacterium]